MVCISALWSADPFWCFLPCSTSLPICWWHTSWLPPPASCVQFPWLQRWSGIYFSTEESGGDVWRYDRDALKYVEELHGPLLLIFELVANYVGFVLDQAWTQCWWTLLRPLPRRPLLRHRGSLPLPPRQRTAPSGGCLRWHPGPHLLGLTLVSRGLRRYHASPRQHLFDIAPMTGKAAQCLRKSWRGSEKLWSTLADGLYKRYMTAGEPHCRRSRLLTNLRSLGLGLPTSLRRQLILVCSPTWRLSPNHASRHTATQLKP